MRLAIISDIHGNVPALEAALADIERHGTDRLVCLGDVASFGPQPL
jgi:predicted phosphodiesterase